MASTMQVDVVSAERRLYSGEATGVDARSPEGEIGILPGHQPVLLGLGESPVRVHTTEGDRITVAVHHGFLEFRENQLTVLADIAELVGDIDVERARQARRRAQERVSAGEDEAQAELERAELRLRLVGAE